MEKSLKNQLEYFLENFNAHDIHEYFCNGSIGDDWEEFFHKNSDESIYDYLMSEAYTIELDYWDAPDFDERVRKTIETALTMCEK
ncbi:MAG: hypothetical protein WBO70_02695 [Erysipelotrichaceae bacterium]